MVVIWKPGGAQSRSKSRPRRTAHCAPPTPGTPVARSHETRGALNTGRSVGECVGVSWLTFLLWHISQGATGGGCHFHIRSSTPRDRGDRPQVSFDSLPDRSTSQGTLKAQRTDEE